MLLLLIAMGSFGTIEALNSDSWSTRKVTMSRLSNSESFLKTMQLMYMRYGKEIASFRIEMKNWCEIVKSCKYLDLEIEMIYMLIRETKPKHVFEMAPNAGFSTHWILKALSLNDVDGNKSDLTSVDIHDRCLKHMSKELSATRWTFQLGSYTDQIADGRLDMSRFDYIFIDALHTEEFSRGYVKSLLVPHKVQAIVSIHDIVADEYGGGRESQAVYTYLAFARNVHNVFSLSHYGMPSLFDFVDNATSKINSIRAEQGIIKPCNSNTCAEPSYDQLYHRAGSSPTIFFSLN